MSESTSRSERRALRRVAGEEVLGVVKDQHQAVLTLQAGLNSLQGQIHALGVQYQPELDYYTTEADRCLMTGLNHSIDNLTRDMGEHVASLKRQQGATFNSLAEFCGRPFLGRLRWLLIGK